MVEPSAAALAEAIGRIDDDDAAARGAAARTTYELSSTPKRGLASLLEIYASL